MAWGSCLSGAGPPGLGAQDEPMDINVRREARSAVRICVLAGPAWQRLGRPLQVALEAGLARGPVACGPTLGHGEGTWQCVFRAPEWTDPYQVKRHGGLVARCLVGHGLYEAGIEVAELPDEGALHLFLTGLGQGGYAFDRYRPTAGQRLERIEVVGRLAKTRRKALGALDEAIVWCRDLINTPASDLGPAEFVREARRMCRGTDLHVRLLDERACRQHGLGCLLAVGAASPRRPRLLVVEHPGDGKNARRTEPLALCGKGVCFDTGGVQVKTGKSMELMRKDMGGAATCLAALLSATYAGIHRPVRAYLPLVENSVGGGAMRPGDVLTAADGTTIEVGHTDAEGRLILADALALARREGAGTLISVATLTGAALVALGRIHVPVMGDDEPVAALLAAGEAAGERLWRLPLVEEHHQLVRQSQLAQLTNSAGPEAACITAGAFLAHFAGQVPFAHCDISPASWQTRDHDLGPAGATGILVDTLSRLCSAA